MDQGSRMRRYAECAEREAAAADQATCEQSARLHLALAEMYRHEAAKMDSVRQMLGLAFVV